MKRFLTSAAALLLAIIPALAQTPGGASIGMSGSGTSKQFQVLDAPGGQFLPFLDVDAVNHTARLKPVAMPAIGGDLTCAAGTATCSVVKIGGIALAPSATIDATNAANISQGILPTGRLFGVPADAMTVTQAVGAAAFPLSTAFPFYDVRFYRLSGDTNDSPAVMRAFAACYAGGGGFVWFPPKGSAYNLGAGIVTYQNGCTAKGVGIPNWPGTIGTKAQWTAFGSWVACNDTAVACFDFHGSGAVEGLNFWWDQPAPSAIAGTAWTPTVFPWAIVFRQNFSHASGNQLANAYQGIDFEYPTNANIGGTYSYVDHNFVGAFKTGFRFAGVNDTMSGYNNHVRTMWNAGNSNMVTYQEANLQGMDIEYLDNATFVATEFYNTAQAVFLKDGTATYGGGTITAAIHNSRFFGTQFNQVVQAVNLATGTTHVSVDFENTTAQSDTDTNRAAGYFFNLASDNVDVGVHGLNAPNIGYSIFAVGGGTAGRLRASDINVGLPNMASSGYGSLGAGGHAFSLAAGSTLDLPTGTQSIKAAPNAGAITGCLNSGSCGTVKALSAAAAPTAP